VDDIIRNDIRVYIMSVYTLSFNSFHGRISLDIEGPTSEDMQAAWAVLKDWAIVAGKISLVVLSIFASLGAACALGYSVVPLFTQGALGVIGGVTGMGAALGLVGGTVYGVMTQLAEGYSQRMFRMTNTNLKDCKRYLLESTLMSVYGAVTGAGMGLLSASAGAAMLFFSTGLDAWASGGRTVLVYVSP
jgi:hypothetical protein